MKIVNEFWKSYLAGYEHISFLNLAIKPSCEDIEMQQFILNLSTLSKCHLDNIESHKDLGVEAFIYTAWGLLLQRFNNTDDVIFGTIHGKIKVEKVSPFRFNYEDKKKLIDILCLVNNEINNMNSNNLQFFSNNNFIDLIQLDSIILIRNNNFKVDKNDVKILCEKLNTKIFLEIDTNNTKKIKFYFNKLIINLDTIQKISQSLNEIINALLTNIEIIKGKLNILTVQI